jgi:hypothetical protein
MYVYSYVRITKFVARVIATLYVDMTSAKGTIPWSSGGEWVSFKRFCYGSQMFSPTKYLEYSVLLERWDDIIIQKKADTIEIDGVVFVHMLFAVTADAGCPYKTEMLHD